MLSALLFSGPAFGVMRPIMPYLTGGKKCGDDADDIDLTGGMAESANKASFAAAVATGTMSEEQKRSMRESFTGLVEEEQGDKVVAIKLTVHGAKELMKMDMASLSDPYAQAKLGTETKHTKTVANSREPEWEEVITLNLDEFTNTKQHAIMADTGMVEVEIKLKDSDQFKSDNILGTLMLKVGPGDKGDRAFYELCDSKFREVKQTRKLTHGRLELSWEKVYDTPTPAQLRAKAKEAKAAEKLKRKEARKEAKRKARLEAKMTNPNDAAKESKESDVADDDERWVAVRWSGAV